MAVLDDQPSEPEEVVAGADTHEETVHVAVVTVLGVDIADCEFPTTPSGYRAATDFLFSHGTIRRVGIEGTSSYGAGLARAAKAAGLVVVEVNRPNRAERRRRGKSDPIDAYHGSGVLPSLARSDHRRVNGGHLLVGGVRRLRGGAPPSDPRLLTPIGLSRERDDR